MTEWSVALEAAADDDSTEEAIAGEALWPLLDALGAYAPAVGGGDRRYDAQFSVEAPDVGQALTKALRVWRRAVANAGLPPWPLVQATVLRADELDRALSQPTLPELVGVSEIAALLGTTRNRAWQVTKKPGFPKPVAELASGPVWAKPMVGRFLEEWRRRPGPAPGVKRDAAQATAGGVGGRQTAAQGATGE